MKNTNSTALKLLDSVARIREHMVDLNRRISENPACESLTMEYEVCRYIPDIVPPGSDVCVIDSYVEAETANGAALVWAMRLYFNGNEWTLAPSVTSDGLDELVEVPEYKSQDLFVVLTHLPDAMEALNLSVSQVVRPAKAEELLAVH